MNLCLYVHDNPPIKEWNEVITELHYSKCKLHSFLKQFFAQSSLDTIWWVLYADFQAQLSYDFIAEKAKIDFLAIVQWPFLGQPDN